MLKNSRYKKVIIAGFGPYCFSSHLKTILKYQIEIPLVLEIEDQVKRASDILKALDFKYTEVISIPVENKSDLTVPESIQKKLIEKFNKHQDALFVISSEPQGHQMWINFVLEASEKWGLNIDVFVDKPVLAEKNISVKSDVCRKSFDQLDQLIKRKKKLLNFKVYVGIDRPFTQVGEDIFSWIKNNSNQGLYLNYASIDYCFGEGSTLFEQKNKENHPYKYGYGILYHSGLHLVDMLARFLKQGLSTEFDFNVQAKTLKVPGLVNSGETDYCGIFEAQSLEHSPSNEMKKTLGMIHMSSLGFTRRSDFTTEIKNPYHQLNKVRSERYEIHMGYHKKLIYTGHNSGEASLEDRIEKIEFFDSSEGRTYDYLKKDYTSSTLKLTALENVLTNPLAVVTLEEAELSQKLLKEMTLAICTD